MKNFKKVVFSMLAMLVMVTGVNAAEVDEFSVEACKEVKDSKLPDNVCTLTKPVKVSSATEITKDGLTIITSSVNTLTFEDNLTIKRDVKVTINGGVTLKKNLTLEENSYLKVTGANEELRLYTKDDLNETQKPNFESTYQGKVKGGRVAINLTGGTSNAAVTHDIIVDHATLEVSGNDKGFVNTTTNKLNIVLHTATLKINDNKLNAMNGGTVTAEASTIETNNNGMGGFNAVLTAKYNSTLKATGNGFQGVTLAEGSEIQPGSKINATDNLKGNELETVKREVFKADVTLAGNVTVNGELVAGSIGMEKSTWTTDSEVAEGKMTISSTSNIDVDESKTFCQAGKNNEMTGCTDPVPVEYESREGDYAVVSIGDKTYLYTKGASTKDIVVDNVDNLVVTKTATFKSLTVAPGTTVTNATGSDIYVAIKGSDNAVKVPAAETGKDPVPTVVGTKTDEPTPGTPGEGQGEPSEGEPSTGDGGNTGSTGDNTTGTNPGTFDGIASFVTLAISSLSAAGYSIKKIVRR